ncbi:hypothetical protein ACFRR7_34745 [Streptomyces sp. NPDC056909]|uniref:hypothetical protein n=1 Tax=Streptomyces sp. NPDC056909 TaxID=3345963 RepID=UPI0036C94D08
MIARPTPAVTTPTTGPSPRVVFGMAHTVRVSTPAEIQREEDATPGDDGRGYERDETDNVTVFHQLVQHLVADGDRRATSADRRAPRLLREMEDRLAPRMGTCGSCNGDGGTTTTTTTGNVTRSSWKSCTACNGSGTR